MFAQGIIQFTPSSALQFLPMAFELGEALARLGRRRSKRVEIFHNPDIDPVRAGVPTGGLVLIRPDGHIGFRSPSNNARALAALDRHLSSYLIPEA
jgi:hypothetical protein